MTRNKLLQLLLIGLFLTLMGCSHQNARMSRLQHLDSLMEEHPQEVYDTLCQMKSNMEKEQAREVLMKYRVLMAKAQNKLYLQMPSDSSFQEVMDYYEKNGTPNECMEAKYLLGCIYRDQKEAPMAMQCYQKAVEYADTLSDDCDYVTLFSIYGQISEVLRKQYLFDEALKAEKNYSYYALKAGRMFDHIVGLERMASLYCNLKDTTKAIKQVEESIALYRKYGMEEAAADAYGFLIHIYVIKRMYSTAHHYMQIFEQHSGLFDKQGNITPRRGYYNYAKGYYYLGLNQLDSAEMCFQKLDRYGAHFEANKGLMLVCKRQNNLEKIPQYMERCERAMDSILEEKQTSAVLQAASMYNFQRIQAQADSNLVRKERAERNFFALLLGFLVLCLLIVFAYRQYKKRFKAKQLELERKEKEYQKNLDDLQQEKNLEVNNMKNKVSNLQGEIQEYKETYQRMLSSEKSVIIDDEPMYQAFKKMALGLRDVPSPTEKMWKELTNMVYEKFPLFYEKVYNNKEGKKLSLQEWKVCLLTRLRFTNTEIANLLDSSPSSVSNAKQMANKKIFGDSGASTLYRNMLNI